MNKQLTINILVLVLLNFISLIIFLVLKFDYSRIKMDKNSVTIENLDNANFSNSNLSGSSFARLSIKNSSFLKADLTNVVFTKCNLTNANFTQAIFKNTTFKNYKLDGIKIDGAINRSDLSDITTINNSNDFN